MPLHRLALAAPTMTCGGGRRSNHPVRPRLSQDCTQHAADTHASHLQQATHGLQRRARWAGLSSPRSLGRCSAGHACTTGARGRHHHRSNHSQCGGWRRQAAARACHCHSPLGTSCSRSRGQNRAGAGAGGEGPRAGFITQPTPLVWHQQCLQAAALLHALPQPALLPVRQTCRHA